MASLPTLTQAALVGIGATALMDAWLLLLKRAGVVTMDFSLLGRWFGHLFRGRIAHDAIRSAAPITGETGLGWTAHYLVGVAFAELFVALRGASWLDQPDMGTAVGWGLATVMAPLFLLQPAMGAGIASSRTAAPLKNCLRSVANHAIFGLGLFVSAAALAGLAG